MDIHNINLDNSDHINTHDKCTQLQKELDDHKLKVAILEEELKKLTHQFTEFKENYETYKTKEKEDEDEDEDEEDEDDEDEDDEEEDEDEDNEYNTDDENATEEEESPKKRPTKREECTIS